MYAKIIDGAVAQYPYPLGRLFADNPQVSFPAGDLSDELLAEFGVHPVVPAARPETSPKETVTELAPALIGGVWTQRWRKTRRPRGEARLALWARAKAVRDVKIDAGVAVTGVGTFQSDETSRINIIGAALMARIALDAAEPFEIRWTLADNSLATLDAAQMVAVGVAVGRHVTACHVRAQALRAALEAAADDAGLDAIDVEAGWPA